MTEILYSIFSNTIVAFVILIGIVVLVHEFGHFIAGKFFGIRVEEFSVGVGPKIFSIKKGDTEYRLNWLPLGGYVRFFGADTETPVAKELKAQSMLHAAVYKRAIVSFAGPFANFILSLVIMFGLYWKGLPTQPAVISVIPASIAAQSGLITGDKILKVDGKTIEDWPQLVKIISSSPEKKISLTVQRKGTAEIQIGITPQVENVEIYKAKKQSSGKIGVSPFFSPPQIAPAKGSFFNHIGIANGSKIQSVQQIKTPYLYSIFDSVEKVTDVRSDFALAEKILSGQLKGLSLTFTTLAQQNSTIVVDFDSQDIKQWASQYITHPVSKKTWDESTLSSELTVQNYLPLKSVNSKKSNETIAASMEALKKCGLKENDTIMSVGALKEPVFSQAQLYVFLAKSAKGQSRLELPMTVSTFAGKTKSLNCELPVRQVADSASPQQQVVDFPVKFAAESMLQPQIILKSESTIAAFQKSFVAVTNQVSTIFDGIKMLLSGSLPLSSLGGPIAIAGIAHDAAKSGLVSFLLVMSFISINIGMMNLLPFPALDGGALLLQGTEALYGKPLPMKVQVFIQRLGIIFIIFLFVLVFYNDIFRLLKD